MNQNYSPIPQKISTGYTLQKNDIQNTANSSQTVKIDNFENNNRASNDNNFYPIT
jgi:hypothetical protein